MEELLTVDDLVKKLGVKRSWIYEQVRLRKLSYIKIGKYLRFSKEAISAYLTEKTTKATENDVC